MPTADPSSGYELAKAFAPLVGAVVGFFGVVFGSMIGMPLLERYRDKVSSERAWKNQRKELIERIRLVSAHIDTFIDLKMSLDNPIKLSGEKSKEIYRRAIKEFDLEPLDKAIQQLSVLPPGASDHSGSAQYLVQQLLTISLMMHLIQTESSDLLSSAAFTELDERLDRLRFFITSKHGKELGLEGLKLANNFEKVSFDFELIRVRGADVRRSFDEFNEGIKNFHADECAKSADSTRSKSP